MTRKITKTDLEKLIMVEHPYNILQNIRYHDDGSIEARVFNEYIHEDEGGPIAGGEFGRHIAILGSIALAIELDHKNRHYYLAVHADLKRKNKRVYNQDELHLKAKVLSKKKRTGKIFGEIFDNSGEPVFSAEIEYMVFSQSIFSKVYGRHQKDIVVENVISPYKHRRNLSHVVVDGENAIGELGRIKPHECEGHFRSFYALPVALLGGLFGELGFHLFRKNIPGYDKLVSPRTVIKAKGLAFSGEKIHFTGKISKRISKSRIEITAKALVRDEVVADIVFELQGVKIK